MDASSSATLYTHSNTLPNSFIQAPEVQPQQKNTGARPYHNPLVQQDTLLAKIHSLLGNHKPWMQCPLPYLGKDQVVTGVELLAAPRLLKGRMDSFEVEFTLLELFIFILNKRNPQFEALIGNIELVGSSVFWLLNHYVYDFLKLLGVDNPKEWLPEQVLQQIAKPPRDFDFRIYAPHASLDDIIMLRDSIVEFFVEKKTLQNPSLNKSEFRNLVLKHGFTTFTSPKYPDASLMAAVGFHDALSGRGIDVVVYQKLQRECLFISDGLFVPMISLINLLLRYQDSDKLLQLLKSNLILPLVLPRSDIGTGSATIFDRLTGVMRAINPATIDCAGWPCLLIGYLKGRRGIATGLEKILIDKLRNTLNDNASETDLPLALRQKLALLPQNAHISQKMAVVVAYWLEKSAASHLGQNREAALILTLQACASLKNHGYADSIAHLWQLVKPLPLVDGNPFLEQIILIMDGAPGSFNSLLAWLEIKAFLQLHLARKNFCFNVDLMMHNSLPALQMEINGHCLLLPCNPAKALIDLKAACQQHDCIQSKLEHLDSLLRVNHSYHKSKVDLSWMTAVIASPPEDLTKLWDKLAAELCFAQEQLKPTTQGLKQIEDFMPNLLMNSDQGQWHPLLQSAQNLGSKLANYVLMLSSKPEYASAPTLLLWALVLAAEANPALGCKAFQLWQEQSSTLPEGLKLLFTKLFTRKLLGARPDLASEVFDQLADQNITIQDGLNVLKEIIHSFNKNTLYQTPKSIQLLASGARKIIEREHATKGDLKLLSDEVASLQWIFSETAKLQNTTLEDTSKLWRILYQRTEPHSAQFKELLKNPFIAHEQTLQAFMDDQSVYGQLDAALDLMLTWASANASAWKNVFDHMKPKHTDLCLKAWTAFSQSLDNPKRLTGTPLMIAEAWMSALVKVAAIHPSHLQDIFGKEKQILSIFDKHPQGAAAIQALVVGLCGSLEEYCPQDSLVKLWDFRLTLDNSFFKDVKQLDSKLATTLARSKAPPLLLAAFKICVDYSLDDEAAGILGSILDKQISEGEASNLVHMMLPFFCRLPKEKHAQALKFLQSPAIGSILKHAPFESLQLVTSWHGKTKLTQPLIKHILNLARLVVQYIQEYPDKIEAANIFEPSTCQAVLEQAASSKDQTFKNDAWHLFWRIFIAKGILNRSPDVKAKCWTLIIESLHSGVPERYFNILIYIELFLEAFKEPALDKLRLQHIQQLLSGSAKCLSSIKRAEQTKMFDSWVEADSKLKPYYKGTGIALDLSLCKVLAALIAGNPQEYQLLGINNLLEYLSTLSDTPIMVDKMSGWFLTVLKTIKSPNVILDLLDAPLEQLIIKISIAYQNEAELSDKVIALFDYVFTPLIDLEKTFNILSMMLMHPCQPLVEAGTSFLLLRLKQHSKLSQADRDLIIEHIGKFITVIKNEKYAICFPQPLKEHFLDNTQICPRDQAAKIIANFLQAAFSSYVSVERTQNNKPALMAAAIDILEGMIPNLPLLYDCKEYWGPCNQMAMHCLEEMLEWSTPEFNKLFKLFRDNCINHAKSNFEINSFFINSLINLKYHSSDGFLHCSKLLHQHIQAMLASKKFNNDQMLPLLHNYAFYLYRQDLDSLTALRNVAWLESHQNNVKYLLLAAYNNGLFKYKGDHLFQYGCLFPTLFKGAHKLTPLEMERSYRQLMDLIVATPSSYSIYSMMNIIKTIPMKYNLSSSAVVYGCRRAIQAAQKTRVEANLNGIIHTLNDMFLFTSPNKSDSWQKASVEICKEIFEALCQSTDMIRTTAFLKTAWKNHCFAGQMAAFYTLVDAFMARYSPKVGDCKDIVLAKNTCVRALITITTASTNEEGIIISTAINTWLSMLSKLGFSMVEHIQDLLTLLMVYQED